MYSKVEWSRAIVKYNVDSSSVNKSHDRAMYDEVEPW